MLFDFQRNLVILTPPKCGTLTLHEVLPRFGAQAIFGPQFDHGIGEHTVRLPTDVWQQPDRFRLVVAVRNPFTRVASLYGHYLRYWQPPHLPFPEFVERIVAAPRYHFFNATVMSILHELEHPLDGRRPMKVDAHVRLECLAADLARLGYPVGELPRVHRLPHDGLAAYTPRVQHVVEVWGWHDFERFGYARDLAQAEAPGRDGLAAVGF